ncbi:tyrosine-type recombinase/integrase [Staphylococcus pseudintermedius]|uniref:tyrosine-type recombinase/integrase n=1 Tax=Staphylococcus pseudintermedius TaxID=283734 RepID=UPI0018F5060C|nr:tyrosine-type recombinase/integrase [Staphylococcus pseudintermedius]EGQ3068515.1 tyrosine-type recombinase/integrase [Staphylococcus pseudintermedius]EGQ3871481.1 tyrosine-type recombinase/integrase [Staphylococcus pseudintermedius]EHT6215643.1 tyrosine-type recombinase/integrase [Staphylococcus pseudintermedius]EIM5218948.1 tyrosine-type recombinase/integrase [Staphylococcus pseudintermedius]EIT0973774.1 tyrosine-type recombinase/integrase [Staphylococcus pseudintermedius]
MEYVEPIRSIENIQEMKKALLYFGSKRDEFLFTLGINCGLRISDILNLKKEDIKNYKLRFRESKTRKLNTLPLFHIQNEIDEYLEFINDGDYLFKSKRGNKPIQRVQAYRIINKSAESIGLKNIGTHSLRKTFGYHYYQRTHDISLLMELFNHSSQSVTLRYIGIHQDVVNETFSNNFKGL